MKFINCIAVLILLSFISSCSVFTKTEAVKEEVFFDDGYKKAAEGEITVDDISFSINERTDVDKNRVNSQTITTKAADGSSISEMTDSAGNKSQSRCFENHSLIGCIVLKTSVKGGKEILVYAQNGEVKTLSADKIENALTISPDAAAAAAEIFEGRKNTSLPTMFTKKVQDSQPLNPMPGYNFPVRNSMPAQVETAGENVQSAEKTTENVPEIKNGRTQKQDGAGMQNQQSDKPGEN